MIRFDYQRDFLDYIMESELKKDEFKDGKEIEGRENIQNSIFLVQRKNMMN